ncbi:MAG: circularly permuted type 2 ATP-grasp protein [Solirubrobacterales bacterium]|nr:circularly permuted type 2 ATP-grasp protein [Solirubrobacterales bacterium]
MTVTPEALAGYDAAAFYDEAMQADGSPRPASSPAMAAVADQDLAELCSRLASAVEREGVSFHSVDGDTAFGLDPVPRVLDGAEWSVLEAGLIQRVRALDAFIADVYGDQRIVEAGVIPLAAVRSADYFEPSLRGVRPPGGVWVGLSGLDLVRDASGRFLVLEDNLRTPSGLAYAAAARRMVEPLLGHIDPAPHPLDGLVGMLAGVLEAAAPPEADGDDGPSVVILTDGRDNSAHWEHQWLATQLDVPLVEPQELEVRDGRLLMRRRGNHDLRPIDVLYRRTNVDRIDDPIGRLLLEPWKRGTLGLINAFGTGVGDDKLIHAYVEDMVRFYCGQEPLLPSVPTYDLSRPEVLAEQLPRLSELVVKPRTGHGGVGIVVCPHAHPDAIAAVRAGVSAQPDTFIAQELVELSRHPTVIDGRLEPRHVDLRPFVFNAGEDAIRVLPGGLTRVALDAGSLVVNSSQNGGAKDTWVLTG